MARERKFTKEELFQATKDTLVESGYIGFTFSVLAKRLNAARPTIYKYYENKDELITDYMVDEMNLFLVRLQKINGYERFEEQFDYLIYVIFEDTKIHEIIRLAIQMPKEGTEKVTANRIQLEKLHQDMYMYLQKFVQTGKAEGYLKASIPDGLVLGFIFQTVEIPNHLQVPHSDWVASIKEIIRHGMFNK
ncbi:TetR/AcrR family transcriptional regulator [Oceanobacillus sp. FSL H7-0719]|uniref:TetR/AcrR family transcriptional regulator n=1 Tax=Oceanobacillus sp. FSL H7-0719 TaxID=2954507 RepID=UPI003249F360